MTGMEPGFENLRKVRVRLDADRTVLWAVLNSPPGNVLDGEMVGELRRVVRFARGIPTLRLLAFAGEGEHFSYGASVQEHLPWQVREMLGDFHDLFRDLMETDVPCLTLVRGRCLGGGLELAAFCDRIVVEEGASLGQPEIRLGVFAPVGSLLLPWRCGARGAALALTGRTVDAVEAVAIGLADERVERGAGEAAAERWVREELLPLSAASLRRARRAARWSLHRLLRDGIGEMERLYLDDLMRTKDAVEGIRAFLEKRPPEWTHE